MITKKNKKYLVGKSKKTKNKSKSKVKVLNIKKILTDEFMKKKEGEYFDKKHYNSIIDYDCDC